MTSVKGSTGARLGTLPYPCCVTVTGVPLGASMADNQQSWLEDTEVEINSSVCTQNVLGDPGAAGGGWRVERAAGMEVQG